MAMENMEWSAANGEITREVRALGGILIRTWKRKSAQTEQSGDNGGLNPLGSQVC